MKCWGFFLVLLLSGSEGKIEENKDHVDDSIVIDKNVAIDEFSISVNPPKVLSIVDEMTNFTIAINKSHWGMEEIEVFWTTTGYYVQPGQEDRKVVFTKENTNITVDLSSSLIGIFSVRLHTLGKDGDLHYFGSEPEIELIIKREKVQKSKIITICFTSILAVALALMGLDIDVDVVLKTLKRPIGPIISMICQFGLMPAFAYLLGWLFLTTNYERLGLLLLGCSPGGAKSNFWTAMFDGDVNLSCTMTFLSTIASFAFTSLWIYLLGTPLVGHTIPIPYPQIALSLASFTVPLLLGIAFKYKKPALATVIKTRVSRPFFLLCLIVLPVVGTTDNLHFFYLCTWRHLVSGMLLGFLGYIFGAVFSAVFRQGRAQIIAISLETAIQNGGVAFIVLNLTFPSPYSDMGIMPILAFFFCSTGPIMFVAYAVYVAVRKIREKVEFSKVEQEDLEEKKEKEDLIIKQERIISEKLKF